jgi:hypothetical protein
VGCGPARFARVAVTGCHGASPPGACRPGPAGRSGPWVKVVATVPAWLVSCESELMDLKPLGDYEAFRWWSGKPKS